MSGRRGHPGAPAWPMLLAALAGGCTAPMLGPAQIDALHTRRYDAPPDTAFRATANAMIDMGYHIAVTDAAGGILRAERRRDPSVAEHALWLTLSSVLTLGQAPTPAPPEYFTMCVLVGPGRAPERSLVRFEIFRNGRLMEEEKRLDELWVRIERRLLTGGLPPPGAGQEQADEDADRPSG